MKRVTSVRAAARNSGSARPSVWLIVVVVGATASLVGIWLLGHGGSAPEDRLKGWSSLDWTVKYDGYGEVGVREDAASLKPQPALTPSETHAALALAGGPDWDDYSFTVQMNLQQQLRQNSPPHPWETGWLLFRYQAAERSYYLAHKTNGLELGKLVAPAGTGQVFLTTTADSPAEPGRWYDYRIEVRGPEIRVYIDGELQIAYTDPDPILSGGVGLYTEDAHVLFRDPAIREIPPDGDLSTLAQRQTQGTNEGAKPPSDPSSNRSCAKDSSRPVDLQPALARRFSEW